MEPVDASDFETHLQTLYEAFYNDPFYVYLTPDDERRKTTLRFYMRVVLRYGYRYGRVHTSAQKEGLTLWCGTETPYLDTLKLFICGLWQMFFRLNLAEMYRVIVSAGILEKVHGTQPKEHYYLMAVGVRNAHQGKGIGSKLLAPMLEKATNENQVCYLETSNPRNVPWYESMGFKVIEKVELTAASKKGCTYWMMARPPQAKVNAAAHG